MVIKGHYVGLTQSELDEVRSQLLNALEQARKGNRFNEVDMGGKMGKKALLSYAEIVHELKEVEYALKKLLPEVYGKAIKRLIPNFNKALQRMEITIIGGREFYLAEEPFEDTGAEAFDAKEGTLIAILENPPVMTQVGVHKLKYYATNSRGKKVEATRIVTVLGDIQVTGAYNITGGVIKDGVYSYVAGYSHLTLQQGYFLAEDNLAQIAKDQNGVWGLYGGAGVKFDSMDGSYATPLSSASQKWDLLSIAL